MAISDERRPSELKKYYFLSVLWIKISITFKKFRKKGNYLKRKTTNLLYELEKLNKNVFLIQMQTGFIFQFNFYLKKEVEYNDL